MTPTWYEILDVSRDATPEQIKAAWREATDKFEPGTGSGHFRMFNEAADVLLDAARRRAYDASLDRAPETATATTTETATATTTAPTTVVSTEPAMASEPAVAPVRAKWRRKQKAEPATGQGSDGPSPSTPVRDADEPVREADKREPAPRRVRLLTAILALGLLTVLAAGAIVVAAIFGVKSHRDSATDAAEVAAQASLQRSMVDVGSYDYQQMSQDRDRAAKVFTASYKKKFLDSFALLTQGKSGQPGPAVATKTVVKATVEGTAVVDADPDQVRVLVFLDQTRTRSGKDPKIFQNRVVATVVKHGGSWLIDNLRPY